MAAGLKRAEIQRGDPGKIKRGQHGEKSRNALYFGRVRKKKGSQSTDRETKERRR